MKNLTELVHGYQRGDRPIDDPDAKAQRKVFWDALQALAAAYRHELTDDAIRVYWHALKAIPAELRDLGMQRVTVTLKFFPTVSELINACADVVDARRKALGLEAAKIREDCELRKMGACNGEMRETH